MKQLEPAFGKLDLFSLHRQHCVSLLPSGVFLKDLTPLLSSRSLADIIIVDHSPLENANYLQNILPVTQYIGESEDVTLLMVRDCLDHLIHAPDCRISLRSVDFRSP